MMNDQGPRVGDDAQNVPHGVQPVFDLGERTARFGEAIIQFAKSIPINPVTTPLITQLVKAGTSVGANYGEAEDNISRRDFHHRISICRKESKESKYWLRMVAKAAPALRSDARQHWQEAKELHLIFSKMFWETK